MSRSTFNGPVLIGVDKATSSDGGTIGSATNWGFANMSQSAVIEQSGPITAALRWTGMIVPYNSVITRVSLLVTTAWSSLTGDYSVYGSVGIGWGTVPAVAGEEVDSDKDCCEIAKGIDLMTVGNHVVSGTSTETVANLSAETQGTGSPELINVATGDLRVGMMIRDGDGKVRSEVDGNTFIQSIDDATTLTMTKNAISDQVTTLDFFGIPSGDIATWMNVGSNQLPSTDRMILFDEYEGTTPSDGRAVLTVNYCQAVNLSEIV